MLSAVRLDGSSMLAIEPVLCNFVKDLRGEHTECTAGSLLNSSQCIKFNMQHNLAFQQSLSKHVMHFKTINPLVPCMPSETCAVMTRVAHHLMHGLGHFQISWLQVNLVVCQDQVCTHTWS